MVAGPMEPAEAPRARVIDLRSDTVTKPTRAMMEAMMSSEVGDDVWSDDPTVNALQAKAAQMFGHEAALFCPSGTMTNQIAIKVHTSPGDELICADNAHIYLYEGGGIAFNSGVQPKLLPSDRGRISAAQIAKAINMPIPLYGAPPGGCAPACPTRGQCHVPAARTPSPPRGVVAAVGALFEDSHFPTTRLVCLENTANKGGGACYSLESMKEISLLCRSRGLTLHLDGARLFNAFVECGYGPQDVGPLFDSISICLSKGLGCPVGSLLIGPAAFIRRAHRIRKVLGGGMRQAGFLAGAGIYALDHHVDRLREDHVRARRLGAVLGSLAWVAAVAPVDTNIAILTVREGVDAQAVVASLKAQGVLVSSMGPGVLRLVTHLDVGEADVEHVCGLLGRLEVQGGGAEAGGLLGAAAVAVTVRPAVAHADGNGST